MQKTTIVILLFLTISNISNFLCLSLQIDGEADFVIPLDALHRFDPTLDIDTLVVEANVTESPTGISDTGSTKVQFHKDIWKIEFFGAKEDYFKPGFKYTTYVSTSAVWHRKYVDMQVTILKTFLSRLCDKCHRGF